MKNGRKEEKRKINYEREEGNRPTEKLRKSGKAERLEKKIINGFKK
jgi:hypothetical protein